nr:hypothetical protein [Clostridia bacterium]
MILTADSITIPFMLRVALYELPLREAYAELVAGFLAGNRIPDLKS